MSDEDDSRQIAWLADLASDESDLAPPPSPAAEGGPGSSPLSRQAGTRFARVPLNAAHAQLTLSALRVLIAISAHANPAGQAWPSLSTIARRTGIDRRKISAAIVELKDAGFLNRSRRLADHGDHTSTLYSINYDSWVAPKSRSRIKSGGATASPSRDAAAAPEEMAPGSLCRDAQTAQVSEPAHENNSTQQTNSPSSDVPQEASDPWNECRLPSTKSGKTEPTR